MKSSEMMQTTLIANTIDTTGISLPLEPETSARIAQLRAGPNWGETLLAAARLKHVLGPQRRMVAVNAFEVRDGGSMLALRIGLALAEIDQGKVLVLDANAEAPQIAERFAIPASPGLMDVLNGRAELNTALSQLEPANAYALPLGSAPASLAFLLNTPYCEVLMRQLREQFRFIIVDAGLFRSAESTLLEALSDGVLLAVAAGHRTREEVAAFEEEHRKLQIPVLGAVLTRRGGRN